MLGPCWRAVHNVHTEHGRYSLHRKNIQDVRPWGYTLRNKIPAEMGASASVDADACSFSWCEPTITSHTDTITELFSGRHFSAFSPYEVRSIRPESIVLLPLLVQGRPK